MNIREVGTEALFYNSRMFETSKPMLSLEEVMDLIYEIGVRIGLSKDNLQSWAIAFCGGCLCLLRLLILLDRYGTWSRTRTP
jgi:hypothetical protein